MSEMYHATVQAIAEAAQNIISNQQQIPVTMQTATSPCVETLYSVNNPSNMLDNTKKRLNKCFNYSNGDWACTILFNFKTEHPHWLWKETTDNKTWNGKTQGKNAKQQLEEIRADLKTQVDNLKQSISRIQQNH